MPDVPRLTFDIQSDGSVIVSSSWPMPTNDEEARETISAYSQLIVLLSTGRLMPSMQQAVMTFDQSKEINKKMSHAILISIQNILESNGHLHLLGDNDADDEPVVKPTEAFGVRGGQNVI